MIGKILVLIIVGGGIYLLIKKLQSKKNSITPVDDRDKTTGDELIECSKCGTFTPRNEIDFRYDGPLCKECQ